MTDVSDFFAVYDERRVRNWGTDVHLFDAAERRLYESQNATAPGLATHDVADVMNSEGFGVEGADTYLRFIAERAYDGLDCDGWIEFASTTSMEAWCGDTKRMRGHLDPARFLAFGYDPATGAVSCLDRGANRKREAPSVSIVDEGRVVEDVFSDFEAVLRVLTLLLDSEVVLLIERGTEPDESQRQLVAELRAADPYGFGAIGWPTWYRRAIGGTKW
jgi:hypothetical protein